MTEGEEIYQEALDRLGKVNIPYLVLYGSVAHARAHRKSDIDICGIGGYGRIYEALLGMEIGHRDIISYDTIEGFDRGAKHDPIWAACMARSGTIVHAKDTELKERFEKYWVVNPDRIHLEANSARAIFTQGLHYASNNRDRIYTARSSPFWAASLIWGTVRRLALLSSLCRADGEHGGYSDECLREFAAKDPLNHNLIELARPAEKYYLRCKGRTNENYDKPTDGQLSIWLAGVTGLEKQVLESLPQLV